MDYKSLSDEALVAAVHRSDMNAFEELYERYWSKLWNAAAKRISCKEQAEEIVQDFFAQLWVNRSRIVLRSNFSVYAFTAIRYQVINFIQKETVKNNYRLNQSSYLADYDNTTEELIYLHDLSQNIEKEINRLPEKCREVFELSRNALKNNKEIASQLGISEKTVENHLTKALKRLRLSLNQLLLILILLLSGSLIK